LWKFEVRTDGLAGVCSEAISLFVNLSHTSHQGQKPRHLESRCLRGMWSVGAVNLTKSPLTLVHKAKSIV
jgi:hypothetical protein